MLIGYKIEQILNLDGRYFRYSLYLSYYSEGEFIKCLVTHSKYNLFIRTAKSCSLKKNNRC